MLELTKRFPKKRAFVTGAGSGLGRELCLILAADGWNLGICDINERSLMETAQLINTAGGRAIPYLLDVAQADLYKSVAKNHLSTLGGIDLLINNAGVGDFGAIDEYGIENWKWIVGINQMAVVYGISYFLPAMKSEKSGHIINISSAAAFSSAPNMGAYSATKAAVLSISETLYAEVHPLGINCSVVMPTFFKTNIMQHCRGVGEEGVIAQKLISESGITAEAIAGEIIKRSGNKVFYIILPRASRFIFRMKRWFPMQVLNMNSKGIKNSDQFLKLLRLLR